MDNAVIPKLLAEHLNTFAFLWQLWREASTSSNYTLDELRRLEERLEAHLDGIRVAGPNALAVARERLLAEEPAEVFTAAYFLLLSEDSTAADAVLDTTTEAHGAGLAALREALMQAPVRSLLPKLRHLLAAGPARTAVAAAEILAVSGNLDPTAKRLQEFFIDEDPLIRAAAWRIAAIIDSVPKRSRVAAQEPLPKD